MTRSVRERVVLSCSGGGALRNVVSGLEFRAGGGGGLLSCGQVCPATVCVPNGPEAVHRHTGCDIRFGVILIICL